MTYTDKFNIQTFQDALKAKNKVLYCQFIANQLDINCPFKTKESTLSLIYTLILIGFDKPLNHLTQNIHITNNDWHFFLSSAVYKLSKQYTAIIQQGFQQKYCNAIKRYCNIIKICMEYVAEPNKHILKTLSFHRSHLQTICNNVSILSDNDVLETIKFLLDKTDIVAKTQTI
ncbi:hypothetical protein BIY23_03435 [Wolbachia pipientis]|uniref:Uncharacterized protein n=1 Tax=Wolbachia pipientis TaxID=955 RepID=A0A1E7QK39_WOLPI|nr:hypothetical protein [Wolbachia pipientis]OEY86584.1 hypothetical protein BIY23_03435 [Wolbachia pipientis]